MNRTKLEDRLDLAYENGSPFLLYSLPGSQLVSACFDLQQHPADTPPTDYQKFTIVSFLSDVRLSFDLHDVSSFKYAGSASGESSYKFSEEGKKQHFSLVENAITNITEGRFDKLVMSRSSKIPLKKFQCSSMLENLFSDNQNCLRYMWFHPDHGLWAGATPETLLEVEGDKIHTMSLAGTRLKREINNDPFRVKEREEQEFVTRMILETLEKFTSELKAGKVHHRLAGALVHLYTPIKGKLLPGVSTTGVAEALHPTPAVCGLPREKAMNYIVDHEGYQREFYTGYLGLSGLENNSSKFFVNLRCMKIEDSEAVLYAGGGITARSEPEAEWEETQNKLSTMVKVLAPFL